jgi:preprotein translocase subunit YajC
MTVDPQLALVVAQAAPAGSPSIFDSLWLLIAIVAIFYFLLIRPQSKARKEHEGMLSTLRKGDEVVTEGGIMGTIYEVADDHVVVEVAQRVKMRFKKESVQTKVVAETAEETT